MTSIADAYVDLHINGDHLEGEVRSSVKSATPDAEREADKSGNRIGSRLALGFVRGFRSIGPKTTKIIDKLKGSLNGLGKSGRGLGGRGGGIFVAIAAVIPLLTSGVSALAGALVAFTGAVAQASTSALSFTGVLGALIQGTVAAKVAFKDFGKAVGGDEEALAALAPAARKAAEAAQGLAGTWKTLRERVQQAVFRGLADDITRVAEKALPVLQRGLVQTGGVLNTLFKDLAGFVASEGFAKRFGRALEGNNKTLSILSKAAVPLLRGMLRLFNALQPSANRLARNIREVAFNFADWSKGAKRAAGINQFMDKAFDSARRLTRIFKNVGSILRNVFGAATPAGDGLLQTLNKLLRRLRNFTELASTKNAIAEWAQKGIEVSGQLFTGLGKGFLLIKGLFDPALLGGFINVFQKVMPTITAIVKVIQGALKPIIDSLGKSFAKNGPKFAKLFSALAPLLKGVGSVIGEVISQTLDLLGTIASVITPVVKAISGFIGPILTKFAPIIATVILAFTTWGATLVKLIPIVGKFLAPLVKLVQWIISKVAPAFGFLAKIITGAFKLIAKVVTTYIKVVSTVIKFALGVVKSIVTSVMGFISKIFPTVFGGIAKVTSKVWGSIKGFISGAIGAVKDIVKGGFDDIVYFFAGLPTRVLKIGKSLLEAGKKLGGKIIGGLFLGLQNAGEGALNLAKTIANGIIGFINKAIDKLNDLLEFTIPVPGPLDDIKINPRNLGKIPTFATGTNNFPGGVGLVGERGPELVSLPRRSRILPATETRQALTAEGGSDSGTRIFIDKMMPHNYNQFERQVEQKARRASLGGKPVPVP